MRTPSDEEIARTSRAWIALQVTKESQYDWSVDVAEAWREGGDYSAMSRYVLQLCHDVKPGDSETIGMIGVSPLEDLIGEWPDAAPSLVEVEVASNAVLLEALRRVWTRRPEVRKRIDVILAARGETRA